MHHTRDEERCSDAEIAFELRPSIAEKCQFAWTFKVFNDHLTEGNSAFRGSLFNTRHDAAEIDDLIHVGIKVVNVRHTHGADMVEHKFEIIEGMAREIDRDEVALLVQAFEVAPLSVCRRWFGLLNLHGLKASKERHFLLALLLLIALAIGYEIFEESASAFGLSKILFATNALKAVERPR